MKSAEQVKLVVKQVKPVKPAKPVNQVKPVKPVKQVKSVKQVKRVKQLKPARHPKIKLSEEAVVDDTNNKKSSRKSTDATSKHGKNIKLDKVSEKTTIAKKTSEKKSSLVKELFKNNDYSVINKPSNVDKKPSLVYFCKASCMYCEKFNEDWKVIYDNPEINFECDLYKIDVTDASLGIDVEKLKKQLAFTTFPNVSYYWKDSKFIENYPYERTIKSISKYILDHKNKDANAYLKCLPQKSLIATQHCNTILPYYYLPCVQLKY